MKPFLLARSKNSSFVVKLYSRPFCSPWRGERVVSAAKMLAKVRVRILKLGGSRRTRDGKAKGIRVAGEEALEYSTFP